MSVELSRKKDHEIRKVLGDPTHIETESAWRPVFTLAANQAVLLGRGGPFLRRTPKKSKVNHDC
jgi:hypothetical protein